MSTCDVCGREESMPYHCRHCGGTFCAEHRLPESHDCPGLEDWGDPGGVFDSGFDATVTQDDDSGGWRDRLATDSGLGGRFAYFRGNMTYVFLALMGITFILQYVVALLIAPNQPVFVTWRFSETWNAIFVLSPTHPEYVWTWVTSVFSHAGIGHLALNGIFIFFFGRLAERYIGSKAFTALFLGSGVVAGLGQVAIQAAQGTGAGVLGASGAGLAIMGLLTVLNPNLRVYLYFILPIPLWVLTIGYTGITVLAIFGGGIGAGGTAQVAHLLGLGIGLAYGKHVEDRVSLPGQFQFGSGPGGPGRRRGPF